MPTSPRRFDRKPESWKSWLGYNAYIIAIPLSAVLVIVGLILRWPLDTIVLFAVFFGLNVLMLLALAVFLRSNPLADVKLPPEWTSTCQPTAEQLGALWQGDPPPKGFAGRKIQQWVTGSINGRQVSVVVVSELLSGPTAYTLIHLDGWLPQLTVFGQDEHMRGPRDAMQLEDFEFNDRVVIGCFDNDSSYGQAFVSGVLTPRAMELLLSHDPKMGWRIDGRFLIPDNIIIDADGFNKVRTTYGYFIEFADLLERWIYDAYSHSELAGRGYRV